jgi:hypothetical protein
MRQDDVLHERKRPEKQGGAPPDERTGEHPAKQIYLRTVYPLNPGIPHYVDVPGGW